jgi:hypothetical protein
MNKIMGSLFLFQNRDKRWKGVSTMYEIVKARINVRLQCLLGLSRRLVKAIPAT